MGAGQRQRHRLDLVLALIELEEGVRMFTNIVDCNPNDVAIGMPVEVTFERGTDQISVSYFRLTSG